MGHMWDTILEGVDIILTLNKYFYFSVFYGSIATKIGMDYLW